MTKKSRAVPRSVIEPQRRHGKARVAAVLEAAAVVIAERGYEGATMAEIAERSGSPIGSLYRFFPNKELLADALIEHYIGKIHEIFNEINRQIASSTLFEMADSIIHCLIDLHLQPEKMAIIALLEARSDLSEKSLEFRNSVLKHIGGTLLLLAPALPRKKAKDIAVILLFNMKTMKALTFKDNVPSSPGAMEELRLMNRLYLASKLASVSNP